jgi:hypothetical protein
MSPDLEEALRRDFPSLYNNLHYFDIGDGWEPLVRRLSEKLTEMTAGYEPEDRPWATCVKEKFGTLRFYLSSGEDALWDAVNEAERESGRVCETCGAEGRLRQFRHRVYTSCEAHMR